MNPIDLLILAALRDTSPGCATPERQLFVDVNGSSATPVTRLELAARLAELEKDREVFGNITKDGTKWSIMSNGLARLAEANL